MHRGLVVHLGSVPIDSCSGLGAEIAVPGVEIECTDSVFAADTLEKYATFDPIGGVVSHGLIVVLRLSPMDAPSVSVEGNQRSPSANTTDLSMTCWTQNSHGGSISVIGDFSSITPFSAPIRSVSDYCL